MKCISDKKCIIGEGPIWNEKEQLLYFVNGGGDEICIVDISTGAMTVRENINAAAIAFDTDNRIIISSKTGVYYLNDDNSQQLIYPLSFGNDMKVGPDGRIYVGTQSSIRVGVSDEINGKLYCIDTDGTARILLDGLSLSNGMEWSMDEKRFYHTDSDTGIIREYDYDKLSGSIKYTGRSVEVPGVDGFTIDCDDNLYVACWGYGHIAVVDTKSMTVSDHLNVPAKIPASCTFCGESMDMLAVVTASYGVDCNLDTNAGNTFVSKRIIGGRIPYRNSLE